jgi:hypothetical protein
MEHGLAQPWKTTTLDMSCWRVYSWWDCKLRYLHGALFLVQHLGELTTGYTDKQACTRYKRLHIPLG